MAIPHAAATVLRGLRAGGGSERGRGGAQKLPAAAAEGWVRFSVGISITCRERWFKPPDGNSHCKRPAPAPPPLTFLLHDFIHIMVRNINLRIQTYVSVCIFKDMY